MDIAIINGVVTMPAATLEELLENAAERGANKALEQRGVKAEDETKLIPLSWIADKYKIGIQTIRNRVNERHIETFKNPENRKEKAIQAKDLNEVLKKAS